MGLERWRPSTTFSRQEQFLMKRLVRTRKLLGFLRTYRSELFDDSFQAELETMYRSTGAGKPPVPPAVMAMAILMQAYDGLSDAEAVAMTVCDLRWQMVLGWLGKTEPLFSQGALCDFRSRLIRHDMDRRLLERTVELAQKTKAFDYKKLPKTLRVAMDSMPLEGAGRVEDTFNLLAHAAHKALGCVAELLQRPAGQIATAAGAPLLSTGQSIKRALDVEWSDPERKAEALRMLLEQIDALEAWIRERAADQADKPPLADHLQTLRQLREQDLEPDPSGGGGARIRRGVAQDRRVSVEDPDMRHGRKSKSKRFNGYKRHIAADLDTELILACAVMPANVPEEQAAPLLRDDIACLSPQPIGELYIDRGYIGSALVQDVLSRHGQIICKPWVARNGGRYAKTDFVINMREHTIRCPAGQVEHFEPGSVVEFDTEACAHCPLRAQCTMASPATGRTINIAEDEQLQHRLRKLTATPKGRQRLRKRVAVEHRLAHLGYKQGRRARYRGQRKNLFDTRRAAAVVNLETVHRRLALAA